MAEKHDPAHEEQAPNGPEETRPLKAADKMADHHDGEDRQEKECRQSHSCMTCLKEAPCCSLLAFLLILFGAVGLALGTYFGSVRLRMVFNLDASYLMCVEYIGIIVAGGIVLYALLVYLFICLSTRTSLACLFGTHAKRMFAFVLNYILIVLTFFLLFDFLLVVVLLTMPAAFHGVAYYNINWNRTDCVDLRHYVIYPPSGSESDVEKVKFGCGGNKKLNDMISSATFTLLCSLTALGGGLLITIGLAWLLACLSARIAYLRPPCVAKCAQGEVIDPLNNRSGHDATNQCAGADGGSFEVRL